MMNMWKRINLIIFLCLINSGFSQKKDGWFRDALKGKSDVMLIKSGPYFGLQQGKYLVPEFGMERQWKQIRLKSPSTHAIHTGFNYNFRYKVLGYDIGYWYKSHRIGLTYGANLCLRSDFDHTRFGLAPVLGFKLWQFHLQTGYHFLTPSVEFRETNGLFVSLRFVLINDREIKFK